MNKNAFTLIELLVVIAIIGIISALVIVAIAGVSNNAYDARRKTDVSSISKSLLLENARTATLYPITTSKCKIGGSGVDACDSSILSALEGASIIRDPIDGNYYSYESTTGDCFTISATLSNTDTYSYDSCIGRYITNSPSSGTCGPAATNYTIGATAYVGNQCVNGFPSNTNFPSIGQSITWICSGLYGGAPSGNCTASRDGPIIGTCGTSATSYAYNDSNFIGTICGAGSGISTPLSPSFPSQGGTTTWTCGGLNGGASSGNCTASRSAAPINGVCGTAVRTFTSVESSYAGYTQCISGTPSNTAFPALGSSITWTCGGVNGGTTSDNCTAARDVLSCYVSGVGIPYNSSGVVSGNTVWCDSTGGIWSNDRGKMAWGPNPSSTEAYGYSCVGLGSSYPACNTCDNLVYAGRSDWYLPTTDQLLNCYNTSSCKASSTLGSNWVEGGYWGRNDHWETTVAYCYIFYNGGLNACTKTYNLNVRCRLGQ